MVLSSNLKQSTGTQSLVEVSIGCLPQSLSTVVFQEEASVKLELTHSIPTVQKATGMLLSQEGPVWWVERTHSLKLFSAPHVQILVPVLLRYTYACTHTK